MKKFFTVLSLTLGLLMCSTTFVACSSDDEKDSPSNPLVGTWYLYEYDGDRVELYFKSDMTCTRIEYKKDSKEIRDSSYGIYQIDGNVLSIFWNGKKNAWTTIFTVSGDKVITTEGNGFTWTKMQN